MSKSCLNNSSRYIEFGVKMKHELGQAYFGGSFKCSEGNSNTKSNFLGNLNSTKNFLNI